MMRPVIGVPADGDDVTALMIVQGLTGCDLTEEEAVGWIERLVRHNVDLTINTPEVDDFLRGVQIEAAHQVQRWGEAHDRSKSAENWHWLLAYLAGEALRAHIEGNVEKAKHHAISTAAACLQWHRAISRDHSGRGLGADADLAKHDTQGSGS